ncbi:hypothetical protein C6370_20370 [Bacillus atrophaeus]|uniref:Uncharacterized protein n=1 Tax=Bacillus atrophaeus (strain 1942) TaxID=720555 RepID=A0ABN3ZCP3_BACA1|nr:hypothetical protein BATR1942_07665 [Bacillus atrophaeus 1942]AMR64721.1 hypothetical protein A1D11_09745 [Bacillus subtilis subsp. globigii]ATO30451.1 hypothetical protein RA13_13970 [Bacillus atrophaeus]KYD05336.1 hypothetical protein B4144_1944 [Bacillus atrophaeus]MBG9762188.1 hypothetical protein [Bacillus atrophaeus]
MKLSVDLQDYNNVNLKLTKKVLTSENYQFLLNFNGKRLDLTVSVTPENLIKIRDNINELIFRFTD